MEIQIHADNTVSGTVGGATLVEAELTGKVFDAGSLPDEKKDTIVFILQPPGEAGTDGDFHLKTNLVFDFTMRAGELKLARSS